MNWEWSVNAESGSPVASKAAHTVINSISSYLLTVAPRLRLSYKLEREIFLRPRVWLQFCTVTLYQVWNPSEQSKVVRILLQFHRISLHVRAWCTQKRFRVWSLRLVLWRKIYETISWEFCVLSYRKIRTFITSLLVTCCYGRRITPLTKHDQWMKTKMLKDPR